MEGRRARWLVAAVAVALVATAVVVVVVVVIARGGRAPVAPVPRLELQVNPPR